MKPFNKKDHQDTSENVVSSHSNIKPMMRYQLDYRVVVLGVMYPSVVRQPRYYAPSTDPALPVEVADGRRSSDIIFYDPISNRDSSESIRGNHPAVGGPRMSERRRTRKGRQEARREAINAVVADLVQLAEKNYHHRKSCSGAGNSSGFPS